MRDRVQILVDRLDGDRSRSYSGGHPLYGPVPDVAGGEDAGHARLEHHGGALEGPLLRLQPEVLSGEDVAALVALDLFREPAREGPDAYKDEQGGCADGLGGSGGEVLEDEALEPPLPAALYDLVFMRTSTFSADPVSLIR